MSRAGGEAAGGPGLPPAAIDRPLKAAVVGVSTSRTCGVRDHATLQAETLGGENVSCAMHWLLRTDAPIGVARSEMRAWTRGLAAELERQQPDAVLLHYSVFSYSYRGFPIFVRPTLSALASLGVPLVTVLHEYAYPWGRDGVRGAAWALTQRALLFEVMRASTAAVVTVAFRAEWLQSRRWLPERRTVVAPVFSNLPRAHAGSRANGGVPTVGLFGYSYAPGAISLVIDGVRLLEERGVGAQLLLLGAPGPSSPVAAAWLQAARARGLAHPPSFSGMLAAQALSDALASCDVLVFADPAGPMSRKTTLAASLASGSPVVALDGPRHWPELTQSDAARVVVPTASSLADALAGLLEDERLREELGARGAAFAERTMSVGRSAEVVARVLRDAVGAAP